MRATLPVPRNLAILGSACTLLLLRPVVGDKIYSSNTGARRHRHLNSPELTLPGDGTDGTTSLLGSENWEAYQEACGPLDYVLSLTIGVHMSFYVHPAQPVAPELDCRPLMLHADASRSKGKAKDVLVVEQAGEGQYFTSLPLGTFRFQAIADAFHAVEVDTPGETDYNIVTNNCAVFLFGVARELGIELSPSDGAKIALGLVHADAAANHKLANYVRDSGEIERNLGLTPDATNEQLLERLVHRQIALALDTNAAAAEPRRLGQPASQPMSPGSGTHDRGLVVGGIPVTSQLYPFLVYSEEVPGVSVCGGVLVAPDVVLTTAGLCYTSFQWSTRVQVGSIVFGSTDLGAEWRNIVSDIIVHPNFKTFNANEELGGVGEYRNDFAMMKIEAVTNANLTPAVLNTNGTIPVNGEILIGTGYGRISPAGPYDSSPGLRRTGQFAQNTNCTFAFKSFQTSASFCTSGPYRDLCEGDYGAPLVDATNTVTGLLSSGKACGAGGPNLIARISGGLNWIQETICKLSDYRNNYTFCPTVVCPADLTLLGQRNASVVGGAYLPTVTGSMLMPMQDSVTQFPGPGTLIQPGTTQKVLVTANQTSNCTWYVRVPAIGALSTMTFTARQKNAAANKSYSLDLPFSQNFLYLGVRVLSPFFLGRTSNSVLSLTVKRENPLNSSDVKVLQSVQLKGTKSSAEFRVTARVPNPDNSTYRYVAYFNAQNIKSGNSVVQFVLKGQVQKM